MSNPPTSHRSYSQLNQVRQCGWAYKLSRIDKVPELPSWPAVAGKAVHFGTEHVDVAILDGNEDEIQLVELGLRKAQDFLADETASLEVEKKDWRYFGSQDGPWWETYGLHKCIGAYVQWRLQNRQLSIFEIPGFGPAIEVPFEISFGSVPVHGYIDRIFVDTLGTLVILDIKTGNKPKTDEQLAVYRAAMEAALGREFRWGMYLWGLKTGAASQTAPIDLTHWSNEKLAGMYQQADFLINNGIFIPQPGANCWACGVKAHCDYVKSTYI